MVSRASRDHTPIPGPFRGGKWGFGGGGGTAPENPLPENTRCLSGIVKWLRPPGKAATGPPHPAQVCTRPVYARLRTRPTGTAKVTKSGHEPASAVGALPLTFWREPLQSGTPGSLKDYVGTAERTRDESHQPSWLVTLSQKKHF
ncbi:hypothetical protein NDU88_005883 [Pleurodeles waltl]|uniref:Uncharacterized protein n=1 Tax=Pleurodeles waltl TaxID=8319 RepID=A0AAV7LVB5_PLEWA|nr:hypothetical protein NDU88_005883 [Pleurodeles waltl]